jgi:hypothetical protein
VHFHELLAQNTLQTITVIQRDISVKRRYSETVRNLKINSAPNDFPNNLLKDFTRLELWITLYKAYIIIIIIVVIIIIIIMNYAGLNIIAYC